MGFLNPSEVLSKIKLEEDMTAADFGSGSGGWVLPLAKKLKEGKVFAIDILEEPLSALRGRLKLEKIFNVEMIKSNVEKEGGSRLSNSSCDLVLMTNLFFEAEDKKLILQEGKRVLKNKGKVLIVDWKKDNPLTPKIEYVSIKEIKEISQELGFKVEKEFEAGAYHWGLILNKA